MAMLNSQMVLFVKGPLMFCQKKPWAFHIFRPSHLITFGFRRAHAMRSMRLRWGDKKEKKEKESKSKKDKKSTKEKEHSATPSETSQHSFLLNESRFTRLQMEVESEQKWGINEQNGFYATLKGALPHFQTNAKYSVLSNTILAVDSIWVRTPDTLHSLIQNIWPCIPYVPWIRAPSRNHLW